MSYLLNTPLVLQTPPSLTTCMYVPNSMQYTVPAIPKRSVCKHTRDRTFSTLSYSAPKYASSRQTNSFDHFNTLSRIILAVLMKTDFLQHLDYRHRAEQHSTNQRLREEEEFAFALLISIII